MCDCFINSDKCVWSRKSNCSCLHVIRYTIEKHTRLPRCDDLRGSGAAGIDRYSGGNRGRFSEGGCTLGKGTKVGVENQCALNTTINFDAVDFPRGRPVSNSNPYLQ